MKIFLSLIVAVYFFAGHAIAQTDPCDEKSGAAYGLCTAYCTAMDCDGEPQASATACTRVADNYFKITGEGISCGEGCWVEWVQALIDQKDNGEHTYTQDGCQYSSGTDKCNVCVYSSDSVAYDRIELNEHTYEAILWYYNSTSGKGRYIHGLVEECLAELLKYCD